MKVATFCKILKITEVCEHITDEYDEYDNSYYEVILQDLRRAEDITFKVEKDNNVLYNKIAEAVVGDEYIAILNICFGEEYNGYVSLTDIRIMDLGIKREIFF